MKSLMLLLISSIFFVNCYASSVEEETICSPTECYTIKQKLGAGAFGAVYAVEDSKGQKFALKTAHEEPFMVESMFADMEREYQRGQLLDHPNIIKSYDLFTMESDPNKKYLVLQFVDGQTISETSKETLTRDEALHAVIQLSQALKYALSLNLFHYDLHNANVMLTKSGDIMVVDLASFFTIEELYGFVQKQDPSEPKAKGLNKTDPKIQQFFQKNPLLFQEIKKQVSNNLKRRSPEIEIDLHPLHRFYLDRICDMSIDIVRKTNLTREEKFHLYADIKKIVWTYTEDVEDNHETPIDLYFDSFLHLLETTY